jgi:hypothetical protein
MKKLSILFTLLVAITVNSFSQSDFPKFGEFSREEIELKECSFDKNADAVILFDKAVSNYDDDWQLVTSRRVRIKILNERGIDNGDIIIPFYSRDNFENIHDVEGVSYNPGSSPELSYLNRKSVYTEKVNDHLSRIKFAIPNVKAGTILEYQYESVMKHYGGLDEWKFQSELPTMKSSYLLYVIPNTVFDYVLFKKPEYKVTVISKPDLGQVYFEMNNIKGLRFEPYMDAARDYFQKVQFQLSSYITQYGVKKKVFTSWDQISKTLAEEDALGGTLRKSLPVPNELKSAVLLQSSTEGKINAVYNYVNLNFSPNGYDTKYVTESLKKITEKHTGTNGEINLILINYLRSLGFEAYPMIAADRDFGSIDPRYALVDRFNKTVACVMNGEKTYILDATEKHLPYQLIPYSLLNTYGLVVDKKKGMLVKINCSGGYTSEVNINATLSANGSLQGNAEINNYEYAKQDCINEIESDKNKYITGKIQTENEGLSVTNLAYEYLPDLDKPLKQVISFQKETIENGGYILLNYNLFTGLTENPFKAAERFTSIDFGYPYNLTLSETIELPKGSVTENLLTNKTISSPDKNIMISRKISRQENKLKIEIEFEQSITVAKTDLYPEIRDLYKQITDMLNEPIVIKVKP